MLPTFVPTIMLLAPADSPSDVIRAVVWGEAMAFMLPPVDGIVVPQPDQTMRWIPYAELAPHLQSLPQRPAEYTFALDGHTWHSGLAHHVIEDNLTEGPLFELLTRGGEPLPELTRTAPGMILDAELLEA